MPRLNLLFDVSALGYAVLGPQHRTGLFQVAVAYLEELRLHPEVELGLYSSSGNRVLVTRFLEASGWKRQPWVGNPLVAFLYFATTSLEFAVYRSPLRPVAPAFSLLKAAFAAVRSQADRRALKRWTTYLSPMEAIPLSVRDASLTCAVVVHDLIPMVLPAYRQDPADPTRWFSGFWRSAKNTDLVFAVSEATRQDWLRLKTAFPGERITVVPNAVDPTRFHPQTGAPTRPYFLAISTIEPRKRLDAMVAGYQAYRRAGGTTPLRIGGQDKAGVMRPSEGIEWLGFVEDADLPGLYASCTAFLSFSEYEGFGLPILEAMACGAPVIVSDRTSHPEVAGDAGVYIDPDDTETITKALAEMDNPVVRDSWAQRSLVRAQNFSWKTTVAAVVERLTKELK